MAVFATRYKVWWGRWKPELRLMAYILELVVFWRLVLLLGLGLGLWALSETNFSFPYARARLVGRGPVTVWEWGNFDGVHYLQIAERGYVDEFSQALFPVYPLVARGVAGIFGWDTLVAGLAVSNVSLVAGLGVWAKWATEYLGLRSESLPRLMWYVVLFPASFFFGAMYTESVFLLLSGWCIYAAYKKEWWWAGVAGGLASATRLVGIFLLPAAVLIWRQQGGRRQEREWRGWVKGWLRLPKPVGLIALGLVAYMVYLWISVGDPIYFVHVQPDFSAHRSVSELAWLPQVVWRYMKMLVTVPVKSTAYFTLVLELVTGVMFGGLSWLTWKRWGAGLGFYVGASYLLPTLTGSFSSLPRYVIVLIPCFVVLTELAERNWVVRWLYQVLAPVGLMIAIMFYTRGVWVG